ncbi:MAG: hypothetical protein AB7F90_09085 [Nitrospirales bacterium]
MPRQPKLSKDEIEQAAILLTEYRMKQAEIAPLFGVSTATTARAVKHALQTGLLVRKLELAKEVIPENRWAANSLRKVPKVEAALKAVEKVQGTENFQELHVFDSGAPAQGFEDPIRIFARPMAAYLYKQFANSELKSLGISWGITLLQILEALRELIPSGFRRSNPIDCLPIAGSPPDAERFNKTASANLAGAFSRLLNGDQGESSTFSVGSWIPHDFSPQEIKIIRRFAFTSPAYDRAFRAGGTIHKLDCVLTSVGAINEFSALWLKAAVDATSLSKADFSALTVGNMTGCFLPKPGLSKRQCQIVDRVNERWLGIQVAHLRQCAQRARKRSVPGVVLTATRAEKVPIVLEAIRHGLVNVLCCDFHLAKGLEAVCTNTQTG